jgi:DDE superfamily endonuclease
VILGPEEVRAGHRWSRHAAWLLDLCATEPDLTVEVIVQRLSEGLGVKTSEAMRSAYIEKVLFPTLAPGDTVISDNLASHKGGAVRQAIEAVGTNLLYLPPYSPDLGKI